MKYEHIPLFRHFFGTKKDESSPSIQSKTVTTTSYSQPHVLQERMREERLTHGETVTANISPVRLENAHGKMIMYFCPMKTMEILETIEAGDGGRIPSDVIVEGLNLPLDFKPGLYKLKNVIITSNGTMQVKATNKTVWESMESEVH